MLRRNEWRDVALCGCCVLVMCTRNVVVLMDFCNIFCKVFCKIFYLLFVDFLLIIAVCEE